MHVVWINIKLYTTTFKKLINKVGLIIKRVVTNIFKFIVFIIQFFYKSWVNSTQERISLKL